MMGPLGLFGVAVVFFAGAAHALPPNKIVGGTAAAPGEFPYMASLRYVDKHFCGGAIVSPRHIVTAAHCFDYVQPSMHSDIYVSTGTIYSDAGARHSFSKIISHPNYDPVSIDVVDDIAVIVLAEDLAFDENTASLDLPTAFAPEGVFANITGWGQTDAQSNSDTRELMKINVKTLHVQACNRYFRGLLTARSSQICTFGGRGVGVCTADSGGPLAYNGQLIGIVSYGLACARGYPDVCTSVYHHLDWLKETMKE